MESVARRPRCEASSARDARQYMNVRRASSKRATKQIGPAAALRGLRLFDAIVGGFLDDLHIVHVRLAYARRRDLDEFGARPSIPSGTSFSAAPSPSESWK